MIELGEEAVEFAALGGMVLDPEQCELLTEAMGRRKDGRWVRSTVGNSEARQNGKTESAQARFGYGAMVLGERVLWTAHEFPSASEAHQSAVAAFQSAPDIDSEIARVRFGNSPGPEIEFKSGGAIYYRARTDKAGRGLRKVAAVVLDEAQHLPRERLAASTPTMAVARHAQRWFSGSAGFAHSDVWWGMREAGIRGKGPGLWREETAETWTVGADGELVFEAPDPDDRAAWYRANRALRYGRMTEEFLADQRLVLKDLFTREHLNVWEPLASSDRRQSRLSLDVWRGAQRAGSEIRSGLVFGVDVGWDEASTCVSAAGRAPGGGLHVETVQRAPGTAWVEGWLAERVASHRPAIIAYDSTGPARVLKPRLEAVCEGRPLKLVGLSGPDYAAACQGFVDAVGDGRLHHLGDIDLANAVEAAGVRKHGDGWMWGRSSGRDVSALAAATVAVWAAGSLPQRVSAYEPENWGQPAGV